MGHLKATCPKLNRQYPFEHKAGEPSSYVCDAQLRGENESVVKVDRLSEEQLVFRPVDEYKDLSKEAKVTETVDAGLTDKEVNTSTIVNGEQPLMGTECSELDPELSRCWEIEQDSTQINDVQGRLFSCLSFWEEVLVAPPQVLECIKVGYKLPLLSLPEPYQKPNHKSALIYHDFVNQAIYLRHSLEQNRCIRKAETVPIICSPLSVVTSSAGKKQLVIDLRYLNGHLLKDSFKYEDLRVAMMMFQKGDYLI